MTFIETFPMQFSYMQFSALECKSQATFVFIKSFLVVTTQGNLIL